MVNKINNFMVPGKLVYEHIQNSFTSRSCKYMFYFLVSFILLMPFISYYVRHSEIISTKKSPDKNRASRIKINIMLT